MGKIEDNYKTEQGEMPLMEDGFIHPDKPEYYLGTSGGLRQVPKEIFDGRMNVEQTRLQKVRSELARLIRIKRV